VWQDRRIGSRRRSTASPACRLAVSTRRRRRPSNSPREFHNRRPRLLEMGGRRHDIDRRAHYLGAEAFTGFYASLPTTKMLATLHSGGHHALRILAAAASSSWIESASSKNTSRGDANIGSCRCSIASRDADSPSQGCHLLPVQFSLAARRHQDAVMWVINLLELVVPTAQKRATPTEFRERVAAYWRDKIRAPASISLQ
jgi:hypothetical protein